VTVAQQRRERGRPRDEGIDAAVRAAAWELLSEAGYDGMSFEAVARRAGCSRAALYRRYRGKAEFVRSLMYDNSREFEPRLPPEAAPREVLIAHLQTYVRLMAGAGGGVSLALAQGRRRDPELTPALKSLYEGEADYYARALRAAVADLTDAFDPTLVIDSLLGAVMFRVVMLQGALAPEEIEALADQAIAFARSLASR